MIPLCIAGAGLLFACLAPFFKWVNVGAGGVTGLAGDGKFMLAINAAAIIAFVTSLMKQQLFTPFLIAIQAWGIAVLFWMGGLLWKISSIANEPEVRDNLFATMLSTMLVSPGPGLYIGLIGGMCIAGSLGYITATRFIREQRAATFIAIESLALFVGMGAAIALGPSVWPEQGDRADFKPLSLGETARAKESIIEAELNKPFVLGKLEITPLSFEPVTLNERPMLGDVRPRDTQSIVFSFAAKNISEGEVFPPFSTMEVIDNFGNTCPDPTEPVAFSPSVTIESNGLLRDLRPGETAKVMIAFDPQIETAKEYLCTLATKTSNRNDYKTWQIRFVPSAAGGSNCSRPGE